MAPLPCFCIWMSSYFRQWNTPFRLVSITLSQSPSVTSVREQGMYAVAAADVVEGEVNGRPQAATVKSMAA